jgi:hypothetical protein
MWEQPIPASFETLTALTSRDVQFHVRSDRPDGRPELRQLMAAAIAHGS